MHFNGDLRFRYQETSEPERPPTDYDVFAVRAEHSQAHPDGTILKARERAKVTYMWLNRL